MQNSWFSSKMFFWIFAALILPGLLWQGSASASQHDKTGGKAAIRLDDFTKTYPPGFSPGYWKYKKHKPFFGQGDRSYFQFVHDGPDQHFIHLQSGNNNFFTIGNHNEFSLKTWPILAWEWKMGKIPKQSSALDRKRDDQAGALCVVFDLGTFGFGTALCYFYEFFGPKNKNIQHENMKNMRFIILRTQAEDGVRKWYGERRNVFQDYVAGFGKPPDKKAVVVVQIDSDSTKSQAEAFYRNMYRRMQ